MNNNYNNNYMINGNGPGCQQGMSYRRPNNANTNVRGRRQPYMPMDDAVDKPVGCDRKTLMKSVYEYGFVLVEAMLFLDTHPSDSDALSYFAEAKEKYKEVVDRYTEMYGPLRITDVNDENCWTWVTTPMPWEVEG